MSKMKQKPKQKIANAADKTPKPRNPLSLNPLMKKSHVHLKTNKTERSKSKQGLKKDLQRLDQLDE